MSENPYAPPRDAAERESGTSELRRRAASVWWLGAVAARGIGSFLIVYFAWLLWVWLAVEAFGSTDAMLGLSTANRLGILLGPPFLPACVLAACVLRDAWLGRTRRSVGLVLFGLWGSILVGVALLYLVRGPR